MLNKDFPRFLPYPEVAEEIKAYRERATVEAVVLADCAHFQDGKQWGHEGETVYLSERDFATLEKAGQVELVGRKEPKEPPKPKLTLPNQPAK